MKVERVDLNLFRVFDAIMTHGSVAAAGRDLGVTASAVSHALMRLRKLLGDELFLPSTDGMMPTARAAALAPSIREGLGSIARALEGRPFDVAETVRSFGIAASEFAASVILPGVMQRLLAQMPHASLRVVPVGRLDIIQQLDTGRIDLVIGWFDQLPDGMRRQTLLREREAMIVRAGHPLTRQTVTKQSLFAYPHIVVEFTGSEDQANDGFIDDRGVRRRVWIERLLVEADANAKDGVGRIAATIPHHAPVAPIVEATDLIATLPERLARRAVEQHRVVMLELPYAPMTVAVEMVWHERIEADPALRWLMEQVTSAAKAL